MKIINNDMLYLQNFKNYIMNENINQHTDDENYITKIIKNIDKDFNIVFTDRQIILSIQNRFNRDNPVSFSKMKKCMEKFIIIEKILKYNNLINSDPDAIELDTYRIKAKYTFN